MSGSMAGWLYFHAPCFDGIVSAVVALDYLRERQGWKDFRLQPVSYDRRRRWLSSPLPGPAAVVDFLYHPQATFWADHHETAFLTAEAHEHFLRRRDPLVFFDGSAGSCAGLIQRHLRDELDFRNPRFDELVQWAEKTDAAVYDSVEEAVFGDAAALRIHSSLSEGDEDHPARLVRALLEHPLDIVAERPDVRERSDTVRGRVSAGLDRLRRAAHLDADGIAVFDVDSADVTISRYAPYVLFPSARYSAGIVRTKDGAKITAMRNPWRPFESVALGPICAQLGGGGHHRVGSIALQGAEASNAPGVLRQLLSELRRRQAALDSVSAAALDGR